VIVHRYFFFPHHDGRAVAPALCLPGFPGGATPHKDGRQSITELLKHPRFELTLTQIVSGVSPFVKIFYFGLILPFFERE